MRRKGSLQRAGNCRIIYFPLLKITRHASLKLGNNVGVQGGGRGGTCNLNAGLRPQIIGACRLLNFGGSGEGGRGRVMKSS